MQTADNQLPVWVDSQPALTEWYSSALGQSILELLERHLDDTLPAVFGYQGLQLGRLGDSSLLEKAGIHRSLVLESPRSGHPDPKFKGKEPGADPAPDSVKDVSMTASGDPAPDTPTRVKADLSADVLNLPIASDVMKIVVLPHTLDFCNDPYQALREADRVLTGDGHMVIIGFSPWSLFGLRRSIRWRRQVPWNGRFYSRNRVSDWLSVLNYQVHESQAFFLRPPLQSAKVLGRLRLLEKNQRWLSLLGGVYLLHARKQTLPITPAKRVWLPQRGRIQVGSFVRVREPGAASTAARKQDGDNHRS